MQFDFAGSTIRLVRLNDDTYLKLARKGLAIEEDLTFLRRLFSGKEGHAPIHFAEIHLVLHYLFGESGDAYDDYKGSFSFPFALDVLKKEKIYSYLLNIYNFRTTLTFSLRKIVKKAEVDYLLHHPFEEEFSRSEINAFISVFYKYLQSQFLAFREAGGVPSPFLYWVDSNLVIYGYDESGYFQYQYDSEKKFHQAIKDYCQKHTRISENWKTPMFMA